MESSSHFDDKRERKEISEGSNSCIDEDPSKLEGIIIDVDEKILRAQGHASELQRSFSWVGALGLGYRFAPSIQTSLQNNS